MKMCKPKITFHTLFHVQLIVATWYAKVDSASILMSGLFGKGSHFLSLIPIGKSLVRQGHEVTFLIGSEYADRAEDPTLSKLFNFEIFPSSFDDFSTEEYYREVAELGFTGKGDMFTFFRSFTTYSRVLNDMCESVFADRAMMRRFESLDVIVSDMGWPCGALIKVHLQKHVNVSHVRLVFTTPTIPHNMIFDVAGSPFNAAYMPSIMTGLTSVMGFRERVINLLSVTFMRIFGSILEWKLEGMWEKLDLSDQPHKMYELVDLVLTSCDVAVEFPFPATPNIIPVGGLTAHPASHLPNDLEAFMQSSGDQGVIIFTLGSYFSDFISARPEYLGEFLDAFRRLPQKVVMQLKEVPQNVQLPENVKTLPWLPQNDLLGHPKTRVFMFHGGNNGFYESIYHGIPMIIIPLMGDQLDAAVRAEFHGIGFKLDKNLLQADNIYRQLSKILADTSYTEKVKRLSMRLRDRPLAAADRAAFWINHVTKFGGDYMRSPFHELSFIQYYLIDVIALISLVFTVAIYVLYRLFKVLIGCCLMKSANKTKED